MKGHCKCLFKTVMSRSPGLPGTLVADYNPGMCLPAFPVIGRKEELCV